MDQYELEQHKKYVRGALSHEIDYFMISNSPKLKEVEKTLNEAYKRIDSSKDKSELDKILRDCKARISTLKVADKNQYCVAKTLNNGLRVTMKYLNDYSTKISLIKDGKVIENAYVAGVTKDLNDPEAVRAIEKMVNNQQMGKSVNK